MKESDDREIEKRPSCLHLHPPSHLCRNLCHLHPLSAIPRVIISFQGPRYPRWSNHLHNRWRSQSASPVVLSLSSPVSSIIAKTSIPPAWASKTEIQGGRSASEEYKLNCCLTGFSSCLKSAHFNMDPQNIAVMSVFDGGVTEPFLFTSW